MLRVWQELYTNISSENLVFKPYIQLIRSDEVYLRC